MKVKLKLEIEVNIEPSLLVNDAGRPIRYYNIEKYTVYPTKGTLTTMDTKNTVFVLQQLLEREIETNGDTNLISIESEEINDMLSGAGIDFKVDERIGDEDYIDDAPIDDVW